MNTEKVVRNLAHAVVISVISYFSLHPDTWWIWTAPGFAWLGQCLNPPAITKDDK